MSGGNPAMGIPPPRSGRGAPMGFQVSHETYLNLIRQLDDLVQVFEHHPDAAVREQAVALLSGIDMLHHEALGRLVAGLRSHGAGELLDLLLQDPVIRTLLAIYGLAELEGLEEEPESPTATFVPVERLTVNGRPVTSTGRGARDEAPS